MRVFKCNVESIRKLSWIRKYTFACEASELEEAISFFQSNPLIFAYDLPSVEHISQNEQIVLYYYGYQNKSESSINCFIYSQKHLYAPRPSESIRVEELLDSSVID